MTARAPRILLALAVAVVSAACAPTEPLEYRPRPDMLEVAKALNCPSDRTPTCVERINKPYSCFCMDEDALRMILEPDKY
ncbi:MAG: hypothetical protein QNJ23_04105 [Woeseiaceae bacterium]|nr:hypothetical protein [Woeseiaceae bacterium]